MKTYLQEESIASCIHFLRGEKVMLDSDIAKLYGVETRILNQAIKRNKKRFPKDFMFKLKAGEFKALRMKFNASTGLFVENSSQIVMSSRVHRGKKYLPLAFTEQGVAMLSGILKSKRAIEVNIAIMRAFVQVRKLLQGNLALEQKIKELEKIMAKRFSNQNKKNQLIFDAIKKIIQQKNNSMKPIGFLSRKEK